MKYTAHKILTILILPLLFVILSVTYVNAENNNPLCIDLSEVYEESSDRDKDLFDGGNTYYSEAHKDITATLVNLYSIVGGNEIFCKNGDEDVEYTYLQREGLLGTTQALISTFTSSDLDSNWYGYYANEFSLKDKNSSLANEYSDGQQACVDEMHSRLESDGWTCGPVGDLSLGECVNFEDTSATLSDSFLTTDAGTIVFNHDGYACNITPQECVENDDYIKCNWNTLSVGTTGNEADLTDEEEVELYEEYEEEFTQSKMEKIIEDIIKEKLIDSGVLSADEINDIVAINDWYDRFMNQELSGYDYLQVLGINRWWSVARDISYVVFIVIFIVVGFMIMFRKKINSDIVVGIGNALPNIVLGLILVTFSFAISGIIMDVGRTAMGITSNEIYNNLMGDELSDYNTGLGGAGDYYDDIVSSYTHDLEKSFEGIEKIPVIGKPLYSVLTSVNTLNTAGVLAFLSKFSGAVSHLNNAGIKKLDIEGLGEGVTDLIAEALDLLLSVGVAGVNIALTAPLVILLLIQGFALFVAVKLFLSIFGTYLKLFFNIMSAPFYFTIGSLPGQQGLWINWLKRMISSVLTFTVIIVILNFSNYLAFSSLVNIESFNFFGNGSVSMPWGIPLTYIIVIGGYFLASNSQKYVDSFIKVDQDSMFAGIKQSMTKIPLVGNLFR